MSALIRKTIEGTPMWLDPYDHGVGQRLNAVGKREECFMWLLRKHAHGVAFDVGANIGYCTLSLAKKCSQVFAFEPSQDNQNTLIANCGQLDNVFINPYLVGDRDCEMKFYLTKRPNLNTIIDPNDGSEPILRTMVSLDVFCKTRYLPNFIKMDIEGGEVGALKGAEHVLDNATDLTILIEVHPEKYSSANDFAGVLTHIIFDLGYKVKYVINAKGKRHELTKCARLYKDGLEKDRAIFTDVDFGQIIDLSTKMPEDGKKVVRAIMLTRGTQ